MGRTMKTAASLRSSHPPGLPDLLKQKQERKRGADDIYSDYEVEEEGRKWRNKNKRNKKIKKKNRKRIDEIEYTDVKFEDDIDEDVSDDEDDDEVAREPSSSPVLQFSAYSAAS